MNNLITSAGDYSTKHRVECLARYFQGLGASLCVHRLGRYCFKRWDEGAAADDNELVYLALKGFARKGDRAVFVSSVEKYFNEKRDDKATQAFKKALTALHQRIGKAGKSARALAMEEINKQLV